MARAVKLDQVNSAGGSNSLYYPMAADYAEDFALDTAEREGCYVVQGCVLTPSVTTGKVDLTSGICFIDGAETLVSAQTAVGTALSTLVGGLSSGQALFALYELDTSGTLQTNAGSGGQSDFTHVPPVPTPNAHRCPLDKLFVPFGSAAIDAVLGSATGTKAKLIPSTRFRPYDVHPNGWQYSQDTWVWASSKSFTVTGVDRRIDLRAGTFVSWNDGTNAPGYGVVASASFSTDTTVNLIESSNFPMANATITRPRFSHEASPSGFPADFDYDPATIAGWTIFPGLNSVNLNPITTTIASSLFTKTGHGLVNGNAIQLAGISTTTGISNATRYYVVSATTNTFQVSLTVGGSAITLGGTADTNITASLSSGCYKWIPLSPGWVRLIVRHGTDGTSGNASHTATLMVAAAAVTNGAWQALTRSTDNGTAGRGCLSILTAGTVVAECAIDTTVTNTGSGANRIPYGAVDYRYA